MNPAWIASLKRPLPSHAELITAREQEKKDRTAKVMRDLVKGWKDDVLEEEKPRTIPRRLPPIDVYPSPPPPFWIPNPWFYRYPPGTILC